MLQLLLAALCLANAVATGLILAQDAKRDGPFIAVFLIAILCLYAGLGIAILARPGRMVYLVAAVSSGVLAALLFALSWLAQLSSDIGAPGKERMLSESMPYVLLLGAIFVLSLVSLMATMPRDEA